MILTRDCTLLASLWLEPTLKSSALNTRLGRDAAELGFPTIMIRTPYHKELLDVHGEVWRSSLNPQPLLPSLALLFYDFLYVDRKRSMKWSLGTETPRRAMKASSLFLLVCAADACGTHVYRVPDTCWIRLCRPCPMSL